MKKMSLLIRLRPYIELIPQFKIETVIPQMDGTDFHRGFLRWLFVRIEWTYSSKRKPI